MEVSLTIWNVACVSSSKETGLGRHAGIYMTVQSRPTEKKNDLTDGVCKALFVDAILPKAEYEDDDVDGGRDEAVQASGFVRLENGGFAEVHDVKMLDTKKAFFNSELNATTI